MKNGSAEVAKIMLSALHQLKDLKFEVTMSIRPVDYPGLASHSVPATDTNSHLDVETSRITKIEELLPPVLSPTDIQNFLGIGQRQVYELLNSQVFYAARVGRRLFVSRTVFIEWLEGRSEDNEVKEGSKRCAQN